MMFMTVTWGKKSILRMGWGGGDLGECQQREKSDKRGDEKEQ